MNETNEELTNEQSEELAMEDLVYGNNHALNTLLDILIEKGVISEQEFKDKLDEVVEACENAEDVNPEDIGISEEDLK